MGFLMKLLIPPPKRFESKAMLFVSGPNWRYSVPPSIRKINSKGTAVLNARRAGSRLLRFWVKVPNTSSEIGTTLSRARACGRMQRRLRNAAGHSQGRSFDDRSNSRLTGPHTSWNVAWTVNECAQLANARLCALNSTTWYRVLDKSRVFSKCHWRIELPLQASLRIPYLKLRFRGPWVCGSRFEERQVIGQRPAMRRAAPGSVPPTHHSIDGGRHAVHPSFRGPGAARAQNP